MDLNKFLECLIGPEMPEENSPPPQEKINLHKEREEPKAPPPPPQPPPLKVKAPEEEFQFEMRTPYVRGILKEFLIPYRNAFKLLNATKGFLSLIEFLDQEGDCPSVVQRSKEPGDNALNKFSTVLHNISLKEHALNVAKETLKIFREKPDPFFDEFNIPIALIAAFSHDIGKVPSLSDPRRFIKADHPYLSALKLKEIFKEDSPKWLDRLLETVESHHRNSPDELLPNILRKADKRARQFEILNQNPNLKPRPPEGWPDPKKILQYIAPLVDKIQANNRFAAFSWKSIIFVQPYALYHALQELAAKEKIVCEELLMESEKENVIYEIIRALKKQQMLVEDIPEKFIGRSCRIEYPNRTVNMILVPVKIESFGELPSKFVKIFKQGHLALIQSVIINPLKNSPWGRWPHHQ